MHNYKKKKEDARIKEEKDTQRQQAAVKIQAMERGRQDKEKFKKKKEAITTIQAIQRGRQDRKDLLYNKLDEEEKAENSRKITNNKEKTRGI